METAATECYYYPRVTDNLQTCMNHAVEAHGEGCFLFLSKTLLALLKTGSKIRKCLDMTERLLIGL